MVATAFAVELMTVNFTVVVMMVMQVLMVMMTIVTMAITATTMFSLGTGGWTGLRSARNMTWLSAHGIALKVIGHQG